MVTKIYSATIYGISACVVAVETDVGDGLPSFDMVGLLSSEVREARERVRTALKNSGFTLPPKRITINLAPADIKKTGTFFDLPIAISILVGINILSEESVKECMFAGELSLSGQAVRVNGILPIVLKAKEAKMKRCFVPKANLHECRIVKGIEIVGVKSLNHLVSMLISGRYDTEAYHNEGQGMDVSHHIYDFCEVKGQPLARRAAEITAAGMHNMLMLGSPGAGKTMIAKCLPSILPQMTEKEYIEVAKIHSVAGLLVNGNVMTRPFRNPHHTSTVVAMTGGGSNPRPGEITLSHKGVLFLDELPEFSRKVIEVLRQPLEEREICLSRAGGKYRFPADFIFLAASNPCKCGYYPDRNKCRCTEYEVKKYMDKISGPILDRIDLCVRMEPVSYEEISGGEKSECSADIQKRVVNARLIQQERYKNLDIDFNGQLDGRYIKEYCVLGEEEQQMMERAFYGLSLSVRSYHRIIKVARTIADLAEEKNISKMHLAEAMAFRQQEMG